jgi:predicted MFS family arabinose efflux permease
MGFVMQRWGWPATFWVLGALALVGMLGIVRYMRTDHPAQGRAPTPRALMASLSLLLRERAVVGVYGLGLFISIAIDNLFVVFGAWLETSFSLGLASLGLATAVIGVAELTAEAGVALLADRIGLYRAVLIGTCSLMVSYLLLPLSGQFLTLALVALFVVFVCFEFSMVATISLCTELYPSGRATMMAGFYAFSALGRVAGALLGGMVWTRFGWNAVCAVALITTAVAVGVLIWGVHHWRPPLRSP